MSKARTESSFSRVERVVVLGGGRRAEVKKETKMAPIFVCGQLLTSCIRRQRVLVCYSFACNLSCMKQVFSLIISQVTSLSRSTRQTCYEAVDGVSVPPRGSSTVTRVNLSLLSCASHTEDCCFCFKMRVLPSISCEISCLFDPETLYNK